MLAQMDKLVMLAYLDFSLYSALEDNLINLPIEHVILEDDAFPLKSYLLKAYSYHSKI